MNPCLAGGDFLVTFNLLFGIADKVSTDRTAPIAGEPLPCKGRHLAKVLAGKAASPIKDKGMRISGKEEVSHEWQDSSPAKVRGRKGVKLLASLWLWGLASPGMAHAFETTNLIIPSANNPGVKAGKEGAPGPLVSANLAASASLTAQATGPLPPPSLGQPLTGSSDTSAHGDNPRTPGL